MHAEHFMTTDDTPEATRSAILRLVEAAGGGKSVSPDEVARSLAGPDPEAWSRRMPAVRREAVRLAHDGRLVIRRKGRVVDPDDFKGVYRLALPGGDAGA
jgi:hypothetical protein